MQKPTRYAVVWLNWSRSQEIAARRGCMEEDIHLSSIEETIEARTLAAARRAVRSLAATGNYSGMIYERQNLTAVYDCGYPVNWSYDEALIEDMPAAP